MLPFPLNYMQDLGYRVFTDGEFNLNLFGIRSKNKTANSFDDWFGCAYKEFDQWVVHWWPCTTDPGTYWLNNPMHLEGTAVLVPGQYRGAYILGIHGTSNPHEALVQQGAKVKVYRDADKDNEIDTAGKIYTGYFGINIHAAGTDSASVDRWSAGCQVFKRRADHSCLMNLCKKSSQKYGERFTYTLLTAKQVGE